MHRFRVPIPRGHVAFSSREAFNVARSFGSKHAPSRFLVKAQVKADGRTSGYFRQTGLHGAVHSVETIQDVREIADKMLGKKFVNQHTDEDGQIVHCVYIQEELDI